MSDADDAEGPDEERPVRDVVRVGGPESGDESEGDDGPPVGRDGVMDPDELDIRDRDGVDETDDGRYVISTGQEHHGNRHDGPRDDSPDGPRDDSPDGPRDDSPDGPRDDGGDRDEMTDAAEDATDSSESAGVVADGVNTGEWADAGDDVRDAPATSSTSASRDSHGDPLDAVAAELDALSASHGFALAVAAGGETDTLRVVSGEPTDTLATALRWYARRVNPGQPAEETVAALLAASDLDLG